MAVMLEPKVQPMERMLVVRLSPVVEMDDDQFFDFAQLNRDLRLERNAEGELIIMPPTGWETGSRNADVTMQLRAWAKRDRKGTAVDSSAGYILPNAAIRSPDASWVKNDRLEGISRNERQKFLKLCPDFVIELKSPTDFLNQLHVKMQEWIDNGAQLGWLINPEEKRVYVYRPNATVQIVENPKTMSGEPVLPGFVLELTEIW